MKYGWIQIAAIVVLLMSATPFACLADADLEADAWPEYDIKLDEAGKNRLYILNSYTEEPSFNYNDWCGPKR